MKGAVEERAVELGEYIIEGGGDFIKYHVMHDFIVKRFRSEVEKGIVQLKWSGCPDLAHMVLAVEQGVTRFGTDNVPQRLRDNPDFFKQ